MSKNSSTPPRVSPFEEIKHIDPETGAEYWSSREFAKVLGYGSYQYFEPVIEKARTACLKSGLKVEDHFMDVHEMIKIGKGGQREINTAHLSRYACYLAIQNADPRKEIVALGQTYFTVQTRRQELTDQEQLEEDDRRLTIRQDIRLHNNLLSNTAMRAGVIEPKDYAIFQNHGYRGLYNGLDQAAIHKRKGLKKSQKILDHMGSEELAANWFRVTQAESKIRRESIQGKDQANQVHYEVGREVRQTIKKLGGTMPENLPTPEKSIQQLEARKTKRLKQPPEQLEEKKPENEI
jgi:DNA-damage-inducible protein D